ALCFWPALALLANDRVPPAEARYLRWYLLAGSLLLLKQYPRMDETHLIFSAPLLWLAGSYALSRLHRSLLRASPAFRAWPLGRATAFAALLTIPLAAVWPPLLARLDEVTGRDGATLFPAERIQAALGLPGASIQAGQEQ